MRRPGGYLQSVGPNGAAAADTFSCRHCQRIVVVRPKERPEDIGGLCRLCMGLVCAGCSGGRCTPFERRLEAQELRGRLLRAMEA
jgi:hypothetical protein